MVGNAVEALGLTCFEKLLPELDAPSCRRAAVALGKEDATRVTFEAVLEQEKAWARQTFGFKARLLSLLTRKSLQASQQKIQARYTGEQARCRRLLVTLASRAFQLEKGQPPASFTDLVPDYLKQIPEDPFTGKSLPFTAPYPR